MSQIKEMLQPKMMMLILGGLVMLLSLYGIMNGDEWAAIGWGGEENVLAHDAAYEEMWALHMLPLAVMAIITAVTVTGKELAKMAKNEVENAKISIRNARKEANQEIKKTEASEDEQKNCEIDIQNITDDFIKKSDAIYQVKEKEILTV